MLHLVCALRAFAIPILAAQTPAPRRVGTCNSVPAHVAFALSADDMLGHAAPATSDVTALAEQFRAVLIIEFNRVMVEDFAVLLAGADLPPAHAMAANGVAVFHPIDDIQVMDVLLANMIAAEPDEIVPVAHLVLHLRFARNPVLDPHTAI